MNDIVDMSRFTEAKSDQLNADDLIGGVSRTLTVTKVTGTDGDQPVSIYYEGDGGKPFKPCKTIRRVLLAVWGRYAQEYVGRSMVVYRDDDVTFGGLAVGGIRISHMSGLDKEMIVVVAKSKGKKVGMKIMPLAAPATNGRAKAEEWVAAFDGEDTPANQRALAKLQRDHPDLYERAIANRPPTASPSPGDDAGPATEEPIAGAAPISPDADPFRAAADRLIALRREGKTRTAKDQADFEALPEEMQAEVVAA